jgi:aldehyde dehydrogenase (NAD+)
VFLLVFVTGVSLEPLIGAIAAGNVAVLKPSELAPTSSSLLATVLPNYLDNNGIKIIEGGPEIGEQLLHKKWDKIFFTGQPYYFFYLLAFHFNFLNF